MAMPRGMTYTEKTGLRKDGSFFVSEDYHMWRKQGMPGQIICAFGRLTKDMKDGKIRKCPGNEHIWQSINWKQMFISVHEYWVSHLVAYLGWVDLELGAPTSRSSAQPLLILSQVNPTQCIRRRDTRYFTNVSFKSIFLISAYFGIKLLEKAISISATGKIANGRILPAKACDCRSHDSSFCKVNKGHNHDVTQAKEWLPKMQRRSLSVSEGEEGVEGCELLDCILISKSSINGQSLIDSLEEQVEDPASGIANDSDTRLVVISGGHGSDKELVRGIEREVKYGATSCYSALGRFMDYGFYEQDCQAFGLEPLSDPLIYDANSGLPVGVNYEKAIANSLQWSDPNLEICSNIKMNKMKVMVLNIANYHKSIGGIDRLVDDLNGLSPTVLAIAWCFSVNDDLAMALRARGYFSKMLANHDLRMITGNPGAKLSEEQAELLKDALDDERERFMVTGPKGSGKTVLAAEIAKIKFAKLVQSGREASFKIRLHGAEGTDDLKNHPSELADNFRKKYFNGFDLESDAIKNIWIRKNARDEHQSEFYEILREGTLLKWIRAQDEDTVMILDDMRLEYLEELGSLSDLKCGTLICCSSNTDKIERESWDWREKGWHLPALKLERSYRYAPEIADFLCHHGNDGVTLEDVSPSEVVGNSSNPRYPQSLPESVHPIVWIQVEEEQRDPRGRSEILQKMRTFMLGKFPGSINKILCILDRKILDADWELGPVEGSEADVVIVDTDSYFIEDFSRARKQLVIITNDEGSSHYKKALDELSEYYLKEGKSEEEVERLLPGLSIHHRLNKAWANREVMKVEATYEMLRDGSWWGRVQKGSQGSGRQVRAPGV